MLEQKSWTKDWLLCNLRLATLESGVCDHASWGASLRSYTGKSHRKWTCSAACHHLHCAWDTNLFRPARVNSDHNHGTLRHTTMGFPYMKQYAWIRITSPLRWFVVGAPPALSPCLYRYVRDATSMINPPIPSIPEHHSAHQFEQ